jgi:hypothetical protein
MHKSFEPLKIMKNASGTKMNYRLSFKFALALFNKTE